MIEIQCTSCHTRYRIDERVLPEETPTFKCSRCGHVFSAEAVASPEKKPARAVVRPISRRPTSRRESQPGDSVEPDPLESSAAPQSPAPASEPEASAAQSDPETANASVAEPPPAEAPNAEAPGARESRTEELFNRSFDQPREDESEGENLRFDFSDENRTAPPQDPEADEPAAEVPEPEWQVGDVDDNAPAAPHARQAEEPAYVRPPRAEPRRFRVDDFAIDEPAAPVSDFAGAEEKFAAGAGAMARSFHADRANLPDDVAYIAARGQTHSSGMLLLMFFAVAVFFGALSTVICGTPIASARALSALPMIGGQFARPIVPATLVALHGVGSSYRQIKSGEQALVITGSAENVGQQPLHAILLSIDLLDGSQRQLAAQTAYIGNGLSPRMIGEMTPREIEFLQRLDPQKSFVVFPTASAPFTIVFLNPPRGVANLRIEVARASAVPQQAAPHR
jgi:predicted Zn finger-like uncharacterized protein